LPTENIFILVILFT